MEMHMLSNFISLKVTRNQGFFMDFCHFLAEWTAFIIIPIIIIGTNIWVDVMGVSRVQTTEQIHEKCAKNGAKTP